LGHWYAKSQARALGLKDSMKNKFLAHIEEPIALVTMQLLHDKIHAHFPNVNPNTDSYGRFFVHLKDFRSPTYVMINKDLK